MIKQMEGNKCLIESLEIAHGSHATWEEGMCIMEAASYIAGEPHSDHPTCVTGVVTNVMIGWNDGLNTNAARNRWLRPLLPHLLHTRPDYDAVHKSAVYKSQTERDQRWNVLVGEERDAEYQRLAMVKEWLTNELPKIVGGEDGRRYKAPASLVALAHMRVSIYCTGQTVMPLALRRKVNQGVQDLIRRMCDVKRWPAEVEEEVAIAPKP